MSGSVSENLIDARETFCPVPILHLARALRTVQAGTTVTLLATDPAVEKDLEAFCASTGHVLVSFSSEARMMTAQVRKAG